LSASVVIGVSVISWVYCFAGRLFSSGSCVPNDLTEVLFMRPEAGVEGVTVVEKQEEALEDYQ
jgi:hypothetical protein